MKRPTISVVIPTQASCWVKGRERKYFHAALRSVLSQTYEDFEVVVVYPPSVPLPSFRDRAEAGTGPARERVRYVPSRGSTVGASRNAGIRAARGEWLAFCDSDDLWFPHKLSVQVAFVQRNRRCDLVHSDAIAFFRREKTFEAGRLSSQARPLQGHLTGEKLHHPGYFVLTSSVIMKKKIWEQSGPFDESLWACEDDAYLLKALPRISCIGYVPEPLLLFRIKRERPGMKLLRQKAEIYLTQRRGYG